MSSEDDNQQNPTVEEENTATYEPVVKLQEVDVDDGERDESEVYKQRCLLYRFDGSVDPATWKERGKGDVRILKHKTNGKMRVVLREEKTFKLRMNHFIDPAFDLRANATSDKFWSWRAEDYAEDTPRAETFGIRFKTPEIANEFKAEWDKARKANETSGGSAGTTTAAAAASSDEKQDDASLWYEIVKDKKVGNLAAADIQALFKQFDKNNDNTITGAELRDLLLGLIKALVKSMSMEWTKDLEASVEKTLPGHVERALKQLDKNKDGKITYDEFLSLNDVKMVSK